MYRLVRPCVFLLFMFAPQAAGDAAERPAKLPVGSQVLAKHPGVKFRIKNNDQGEMHAGVIERVQKVQGEWLWLGRGWVPRRDVVSLWDAVEYFTAEIARKPTAFACVARAAAKGREGGFASEIDNDIDQALKFDPDFAAAHYLRGVTFRERQEYDSAIDAFDDAISFNPTLADAYNDRGRARYDKAAAYKIPGRAWDDRKDLEKALWDLNRAIQLCPRLAKAYANRATIFLAKGENERALAEAQESLKHGPAASAAYRHIGAYWVAKGDDERAMAAYSEAVRLNPKCGKARFERGKIHSRQGDHEKAIADLSQAVELLPKNAEALEARGFAYYRLGATEKSNADRIAAARLQRAASAATLPSTNCEKNKKPAENEADVDPWRLYNALHQTAPGANDATTAKSNPAQAEAPRSRASTLDASARRCATSTDERYLNGERAVEAATEACELSKWKRADYIDTLAAAYAETGDFDAAVKWQTKAIELAIGAAFKAEAEQRLQLYRDHQPCREDSQGRVARGKSDDGEQR
ncbi:MAG TPA: tetratricopeptide repeat protein [Pirellulales bacterium]|nr:tetratricopeptide repeat protein [Pirellulales bacterium]